MAEIFIQDYAFCNVLGQTKSQIWQNLQQHKFLLKKDRTFLAEGETYLGKIEAELPPLPETLKAYDCRNNQLIALCLAQLRPSIENAIQQFGADRVAVVMGTSTAGVDKGEKAIAYHQQTGEPPLDYDYRCQELGSISGFTAKYLGLTGVHFSISTACSSSARVFVSAQRLLNAGLADAVIVGGADTLCHLTVNGFHSLSSLSALPNQPFQPQRDGINIGEACAIFLLSKQPSELALAGVGESSDAHHISAPEPNGKGAEAAMRMALAQAKALPEDIGYLNLHGTATPLNDSMESLAVQRVFGKVPCSSTKALTGHTLGAAGATEAAIACLLLEKCGDFSENFLPKQAESATELDPNLPEIGLITTEQPLRSPIIMSNSFAFGGNNMSLVFKKVQNA